MAPTGAVIVANRIASSPDFEHAIIDAWELPNGDLICIVEYDENPTIPLDEHVFIKRFSPNFTELWSQNIPNANRSHLPTILPAGSNQFYVYIGNTPEGRIIKISETGQILWAKVLNTNITKISALTNGNLVVSHSRTSITQKANLSLLSPNGSVLKSIELPYYTVWGHETNVFPGGDILISSDVHNSVEYQRLSSDLSPKKVWRISCSPDSYNGFNATTIANDSLIYFRWHTGDGSSVLGTMDGVGNIKKSILLTRFSPFAWSTEFELNSGPNGWCGIASLISEPGMLLYSLDSSLTLPGCTLPIFSCLESIPVEAVNLPASVTATPATLSNYQYSLPWEPFSPTVIDTCFVVTPPDPFFNLPDTLCLGVSLTPDSVNVANVSENEWIIGIGNAASDTSFATAPTIIFDTPGLVNVVRKVHYLGCQTDSFSRIVLVLPEPSVELGPDTSFCTENSFLLSPIIEGAYEWHWNDQDTSIQKEIEQPGVYFLEASNGICSARDTIEIKFGTADASFGVVSGVCSDAFFTPVPIEIAATNHLWRWEPPILPDAVTEQPDFSISIPGTYQLHHIVTIGGCIDSVSESIMVVYPVRIEMPLFATICSDSILNIIPDTGYVLYYQWENGSNTLERSIEDAGVYSFIGSNEYCSDTATIEVTEQVCEPLNIYIPNVFSPQGNDANARFQVYYNEAVDRVDFMEVYDRWGSLVFLTSEGASWDGTSKGRPAAPGVYVYKIVFYLAEGGTTLRTGNVTLVR